MENIHLSLVTARQIRQWMDRDSVLSNVRRLVQFGCETISDVSLKPFQQRKEELSVHDRCVLWGGRVIAPPAGHSVVLEVLHDGHPGVTKMKQLARSIVWWPGIDKDLENKVRQCEQCALAQKSQHTYHSTHWNGLVAFGQTTCRLYRTIHGEDVSRTNRCSF